MKFINWFIKKKHLACALYATHKCKRRHGKNRTQFTFRYIARQWPNEFSVEFILIIASLRFINSEVLELWDWMFGRDVPRKSKRRSDKRMGNETNNAVDLHGIDRVNFLFNYYTIDWIWIILWISIISSAMLTLNDRELFFECGMQSVRSVCGVGVSGIQTIMYRW